VLTESLSQSLRENWRGMVFRGGRNKLNPSLLRIPESSIKIKLGPCFH